LVSRHSVSTGREYAISTSTMSAGVYLIRFTAGEKDMMFSAVLR